jgi:hypothetical protein
MDSFSLVELGYFGQESNKEEEGCAGISNDFRNNESHI